WRVAESLGGACAPPTSSTWETDRCTGRRTPSAFVPTERRGIGSRRVARTARAASAHAKPSWLSRSANAATARRRTRRVSAIRDTSTVVPRSEKGWWASRGRHNDHHQDRRPCASRRTSLPFDRAGDRACLTHRKTRTYL